MDTDLKIVLPGGAGLVGQNLVARLREKGYSNIVVLDKHQANLEVLRQVQPDVAVEYADLAEAGEWRSHLADADVVVMLQAQIGGIDYAEFVHNNINATRHILDAIRTDGTCRLVHISSSVVTSSADDFYTRTKKAQEAMVVQSGIPCPILRPTLMFGWFDRKHLGWLSRFMRKVPVFPIPGDGRYMRQPLYVGDFCDIIISCVEPGGPDGVFNISGLEEIDYVDIIHDIKRTVRSHTMVLHIPYWLFHVLLRIWAIFDHNPPFTTQQLEALIGRDAFEVIDWPGIFNVRATPFREAVDQTFNDPRYGHVVLEF